MANYPTTPAPIRPYRKAPVYKTLVTEFGNGEESRVQQWTSDKMRWELEYLCTEAQADIIIAFFNARKGRFEAFTYYDFEDDSSSPTAYTARFDQDELVTETVEGAESIKRFRVKIVETNT